MFENFQLQQCQHTKKYIYIIHLIQENITSLLASVYTSVAGTSVNMANQTSDTLEVSNE